MQLRAWQWLEVIGSGFVLLALFFQFFGASFVEDSLWNTDNAILEARLNHIYAYIKTGEDVAPEWEKIEEFFAGPKKSGDSHFRFEEAAFFIRIVAASLFLLGSALALIGKVLQFRTESANAKHECA